MANKEWEDSKIRVEQDGVVFFIENWGERCKRVSNGNHLYIVQEDYDKRCSCCNHRTGGRFPRAIEFETSDKVSN